MKSSKVAVRYAQSLLDLALERGIIDVILNDMNYLTAVYNENKDFQLFLVSPVVNSEKKVAVLKEIFAAFDALSLSFVELIAKNGREMYLHEIAHAFGELLKKTRNIVPITIVSASKLDDAVKASIVAKVQKTTTGTLEVSEKVDTKLIGGFIVEMGDIRIDASVASKLGQLKQRLTR